MDVSNQRARRRTVNENGADGGEGSDEWEAEGEDTDDGSAPRTEAD